MALYFARELNVVRGLQKTAGVKARDDADAILADFGMAGIDVVQKVTPRQGALGKADKVLRRLHAKGDWQRALDSVLASGDTLVLQVPILNHSIPAASYIADLGKRGITTVLLVHDLEIFRMTMSDEMDGLKKPEILAEERRLLEGCTWLIVHNECMAAAIQGIAGEDMAAKTIPLECFDYLVDGVSDGRVPIERATGDGVVIAGNLDKGKAGYVYNLPDDVAFNVYGVNYSGEESGNVSYKGSFDPGELPLELSGAFGLVWDGPDASTCSGLYGGYLRINNPHKVSLYLASGLPVIIWDQAALAPFVLGHGVGLAVPSLHEVGPSIARLADGEYENMRERAAALARKVRNGAFLKSAVRKVLLP